MAEETKVQKKPKKKTPWEIVKSVFDWVLGIFIFLIAVIEVFALATRNQNYGAPSFFGYQVLNVATGSMAYDAEGKEVYPIGIGLFARKVSFTSLSVGDDLAFYGYYNDGTGGKITTHRVQAVMTDAADGSTYYVCQGINTYQYSSIANQVQYVYADESHANVTLYKNGGGNLTYETKNVTAVGVYMGKIIGSSKFVGNVYTTMQKPVAVILMIAVPAALIAVSSIVDMIRIKKTPDEVLEQKYGQGGASPQKEDPADPLKGLSEEDKKKLKEQMVQDMLKENQEKKGGDK
jgi:hypothetical protein